MGKPTVLVHSREYQTDLRAYGITTPFALDRGQMVLEELARDLGETPRCLIPRPLTNADLKLVHTPEYLETLKDPAVWAEIMGLRYQAERIANPEKALPGLLKELRLKSGGTLLAGKLALKYGLAANLGAGYHHAHADRGEGFCAINDVAIAIRWLQKHKRIKTAMIVDVDFHQGNGSATIFDADDSVFTLSIHSQEAWPHDKAVSDLDINIAYDQSHLYIERLKAGLEQAFARFQPDICFFVAGSDAYEKDAATGGRLMKLTLEQLKERDQLVIDACVEGGVPLALVFAGGYGPECWRVHYQAVRYLLEKLESV